MKDITFAALITDRTSEIRLSMRSKGDFDVSHIAREHFNGGGHRNASGGTSQTSLAATVKQFETIVKEMKKPIINAKQPS